ncbi:hypothetical protein GIS00_02265 [Nakamurella sp. YIM 132087]|uniref:FAD-binding PCMH-type domain-containing protein n=1 Tax=Nakamurella alba TaxID=2665158 RepID=A0A7K1FF94_9ACTN|nr:FAD binding domain-containing protein [Nakamurella alba]MTD12768.1 hypothetical protein [Nakamurella alba]
MTATSTAFAPPGVRITDTTDEVLAALAALGSDATVMAGGTEVMIRLRRREIDPKLLLHIGRHSELRTITEDAVVDPDGGAAAAALRIGATVTHHDLLADPRVPELVKITAERIGYPQTQELGTVGGNLIIAHPADLATPFLVHDAQAVLSSQAGTRTVAVADLMLGDRLTAIRPDELLSSVTLPTLPGAVTGYRKVGRRGEMDAPIITVAILLQFGTGATITDARVAVGSYADVPFRARALEQALVRTGLPDGPAIAELSRLADLGAEAVEDVKATARYRRTLLPRLVADVLTGCLARGVDR